MNLVNLIIDCNTTNLHAPIRTMQARQGATLVAKVYCAPDDVTDVFFRVSSGGGAAFLDFPCTRNANGDWRVTILGTAFPNPSASEFYEIRATAPDGTPTAIGRGKLVVDPFTSSGYEESPSTPGTRVIQTLLDESGGKHPIVAVQDEDGEWTYRIGAAVE